MKREELERRLVDFVNRMQPETDPPIVVDEETALFEEGVINSLRILDLIAFVEENTRTRVPDEEVRLANFRSVRAIASAFGEDGGGAGGHDGRAPEEEHPAIQVFERRAHQAGFARPVEELAARGELALVAPGRMVFNGPAESLLCHFDSVVRGWAAAMGGQEQSFPTLLSSETLARAGCSVNAAPGEVVMPPAACYNVYSRREGARLESSPVLLAGRDRCFRNELDLDPSLGRLRVFEMREIVALGSRTEVERFRQDMIDRVRDFVSELGLEGRIELASDPFFLQDAGRRLMQRVLPLKYELRLTLDESGRTCAVASFNHHMDFFGRRFRIRLPSDATAHSGCAAFGLERWVLAFLGQHGIDERAWPASVRESYVSEVKHARIA